MTQHIKKTLSSHPGNREYFADFQSILEEIQATEGLPENLHTEAQLWDEIMKKEAFTMADQLLPLIKEIHQKEYSKDVNIHPLATEYSVERMDTHEIASIRADITIMVDNKDIYHFECQMGRDGTMVLRMFEYDIHIAISYAYTDKDNIYHIRFPNSAVLYLQDNSTDKKEIFCNVIFQDGTTHQYTIPIVMVQSYTLEDIRQKHLAVLIPFLPLRFRKSLSMKTGVSKEELTDFYQQIILLLAQEVKDGYLTETNRNTITSLLSKSLIRVFYRDEKLLKEVITLTEPILELEWEKNARLQKELQEAKTLLKQQEVEITALREQLEKLKNA